MPKLKEFIGSTFCTDKTNITCISDGKETEGKWYDGKILALRDREITYMEWKEDSVELILADPDKGGE